MFPVPLGQEQFEAAVIDHFVKTSPDCSGVLQDHFEKGKRSREMTGVGFYLNFDVPSSVVRLPNRRPIAAADFELEEASLFGELLLWSTDDGLLDSIEGYIFGEDWPTDSITLKRLHSSTAANFREVG